MNPEREAAKGRFLTEHGLAQARREPLAGDASTRSYARLYPAGAEPLILMDQPPVLETPICPPAASDEERMALGYNAAARLAAGSIAAFVTTADYLRDHGLSAPRIVAFDVEAGLAVLEDL
ncbi:MAG: N-acetylmuramate/N-acetylglucosamine kinase AmgK, partial [Caulobacteraceae bacterium]